MEPGGFAIPSDGMEDMWVSSFHVPHLALCLSLSAMLQRVTPCSSPEATPSLESSSSALLKVLDDIPYPQEDRAGAQGDQNTNNYNDAHGKGPLIQVIPVDTNNTRHTIHYADIIAMCSVEPAIETIREDKLFKKHLCIIYTLHEITYAKDRRCVHYWRFHCRLDTAKNCLLEPPMGRKQVASDRFSRFMDVI